MKIGIITTLTYDNYGNKLQNYALSRTLSKLFKTEDVYNIYFLKLQEIIEKTYVNNHKLGRKRRALFSDFVTENIKEIHLNSYNKLKKLGQDFDYFVVGSDQIWNPALLLIRPKVKFLEFCDENKRIAYAPSFGVSKLSARTAKKYSKGLKNLKYISVRESAGAKIIKELTGRDPFVAIDPTLLLTKEEWVNFCGNYKKSTRGYILTYFLSTDKKYKEIISNLARKNNLEIKSINNKEDPKNYLSSPKDFVKLMTGASLICTDSFHGCIFSILMEKPFINFERDNPFFSKQSSRLEHLLSKLKLENRKFENLKESDCLKNIDYSEVKKIIESEREKSFHFLREAVEGEK